MSTEGAELWREGHDRLADEQRKATLKTLQEDADTPADKVAAIQAVYHKDPSVLKQHVENLTRRITGKPTQPVVSQEQAQLARLAPIVARGKTPDQQALEFNQKQGDVSNQQSLARTQQETQQKQQNAFALIDQYIKDPEQNKAAKEDYVRKQAGINNTVKNIPGQAGQPYKNPNGQYVRPVLNSDGTIGEQPLPAGWTPPTPAPKPGQPKSGVSHGKNVFATLTPKGWVDAGNGEPLNDFRPAPSYAQVAPSMRAVQVVDPNDPNSTVYESIPEAIKSRAQGTQSTGYKTRAAVQKAFTTGAPAQNLASINTLRGHLSLLRNATEALQNGDTQLFNTWAQKYAQATGSAAPTNFQSMKVAVASELARTLTGKGATVQEIAQIQGPLDIADSPEQFSGALDTFDGQMQERSDALQQQYTSGMKGQPAFNAPAPKKGGTAKEGDTKVNSSGDKVKFHNGQWGPA
jgi:hypothetical protein